VVVRFGSVWQWQRQMAGIRYLSWLTRMVDGNKVFVLKQKNINGIRCLNVAPNLPI
jgi:hypothetical protein